MYNREICINIDYGARTHDWILVHTAELIAVVVVVVVVVVVLVVVVEVVVTFTNILILSG